MTAAGGLIGFRRREHGNLHAFGDGSLRSIFVAGIDVTRDAEAWIVGQHAVETLRGFIGAVSYRNLTRVQ